jgi:hypothetical protein
MSQKKKNESVFYKKWRLKSTCYTSIFACSFLLALPVYGDLETCETEIFHCTDSSDQEAIQLQCQESADEASAGPSQISDKVPSCQDLEDPQVLQCSEASCAPLQISEKVSGSQDLEDPPVLQCSEASCAPLQISEKVAGSQGPEELPVLQCSENFPCICEPIQAPGDCQANMIPEDNLQFAAPEAICPESFPYAAELYQPDNVMPCVDSIAPPLHFAEPIPFCCHPPLCLQTYLDAIMAWRKDFVTAEFVQINEFTPIPSIVTTHIRDIDIFQLGAQGQMAMGSWFLRGAASYGFLVNNEDAFRERHQFPSPPPQIRTGDIGGHTIDADIGLGYVFNVIWVPSWGLAPMVGWAYNKQDFEEENLNFSFLSGSKFITRWNGPWVGLDFFYQANSCMQFNAGYHLHFTEWRHKELFPAFFQISSARIAYGHTLFLEGKWSFCRRFFFDLGFTYKYFSIGNLEPSVDTPSALPHFESVFRWSSVALAASLGMYF